MERKLIAAFILCILFTALPFVVKWGEGRLSSTISVLPSNSSIIASNGVIYAGSAVSHEGSDLLCVVPAEAYVPEPGTEVILNVTVKFKHAQPCPYSDWEIVTENPENVEVINETETELLDPYTAFRQYAVRVLGNGTLDVVFKYGSGCPYGTEERVTIGFYIGQPPEDINLTVTNPEELFNITTMNITGIVEEINLVDRYFVVDGKAIWVRGRWTGPNGVEYTWKDMLLLLHVGERVEVLASYETGELKADVIIINGQRFVRR